MEAPPQRNLYRRDTGGACATIPQWYHRRRCVGDDNTDDEKTIGFNSHLDLLEFIDKVAPWNKEADLVAAVNLYDNALHHGGRIYRTNAAPSHFSSEWLLAKISPVSLHKHCSGAGLHG